MVACKYCGLPADTHSGYCGICEDKFRERVYNAPESEDEEGEENGN